jgi:hypothetical protein
VQKRLKQVIENQYKQLQQQHQQDFKKVIVGILGKLENAKARKINRNPLNEYHLRKMKNQNGNHHLHRTKHWR